MSTLASNSLPIDTEYIDKNTGTKVFTNEKPDKNLVKAGKKRKTQRKRKLTLKRRKVR